METNTVVLSLAAYDKLRKDSEEYDKIITNFTGQQNCIFVYHSIGVFGKTSTKHVHVVVNSTEEIKKAIEEHVVNLNDALKGNDKLKLEIEVLNTKLLEEARAAKGFEDMAKEFMRKLHSARTLSVALLLFSILCFTAFVISFVKLCLI